MEPSEDDTSEVGTVMALVGRATVKEADTELPPAANDEAGSVAA